MRLGQLVTPEALTLTIGGWSRSEIETAIEHLIELLDVSEASSVDLEPDAETCVGDGLPGDMSDAETDQPVMRFRVGRRLRRCSVGTKAADTGVMLASGKIMVASKQNASSSEKLT